MPDLGAGQFSIGRKACCQLVLPEARARAWGICGGGCSTEGETAVLENFGKQPKGQRPPRSVILGRGRSLVLPVLCLRQRGALPPEEGRTLRAEARSLLGGGSLCCPMDEPLEVFSLHSLSFFCFYGLWLLFPEFFWLARWKLDGDGGAEAADLPRVLQVDTGEGPLLLEDLSGNGTGLGMASWGLALAAYILYIYITYIYIYMPVHLPECIISCLSPAPGQKKMEGCRDFSAAPGLSSTPRGLGRCLKRRAARSRARARRPGRGVGRPKW